MKIFKKLPFLTIFLLLLCVTTTIISCEKDELDKLPAESMSGRNTFGCLINGEAFLPKKSAWTDVPLKSYYYQNEDLIQIEVFNRDYYLSLFIWNPKINTIYKFGRNLFQEINRSRLSTGCGDVDNVKLDTTGVNILSITNFDLENQIFSGTFQLEFLGDSCSDGNYILTEGRIDVPFDIY